MPHLVSPVTVATGRQFVILSPHDHADPVAELRRLHDLAVTFTETLLEQYGAEGLRRYRRVKT